MAEQHLTPPSHILLRHPGTELHQLRHNRLKNVLHPWLHQTLPPSFGLEGFESSTTASSADSGSDRADSNSIAGTTATHVPAYAASESRGIAPKRGTAAPTGQYPVPMPNPSLISFLSIQTLMPIAVHVTIRLLHTSLQHCTPPHRSGHSTAHTPA